MVTFLVSFLVMACTLPMHLAATPKAGRPRRPSREREEREANLCEQVAVTAIQHDLLFLHPIAPSLDHSSRVSSLLKLHPDRLIQTQQSLVGVLSFTFALAIYHLQASIPPLPQVQSSLVPSASHQCLASRVGRRSQGRTERAGRETADSGYIPRGKWRGQKRPSHKL